jgi:hypothetical protein
MAAARATLSSRRIGLKAWRAGIGIVVVAAVLVLASSHSASAGAQGEASRTEPSAARHEVSWRAMSAEGYSIAPSHAVQMDQAEDEGNDRVLVSLATFGAAVAAVVVGSAGYLLRRRLGLVKPPPDQSAEH